MKRQQRAVNVSSPSGGTLGDDIRQVREARRLTQRALGAAAGYSVSYVTKVETGVVFPALRFVEGCDRAFGTGDLFVRQRRRLVEGENPAWFTPYLEAEKVATSIRDFSTVLISGLLQHEEYARAVLQSGRAVAPQLDRDALLVTRLRRREIMERSAPPRVWVILHEACLRAEVGSARVMVRQMVHLLTEIRQHPTLTVQVLPYSAAKDATGTPYVLMEIPDSAPHVFIEHPHGSQPYSAPAKVAHASALFDYLRACSLSPDDSTACIRAIRDDHERNAVDEVQLQRSPRRQLRGVGAGARVRRRSGPGAGQ
ncbi:helix-turn-helix transcriptional regulator [Streptomyces diacarni]|uniref:XRE family transcriptional regulator n=1 Tax=Streptomyces diacarni TaxID=2800381 RepID=A0A367EP44_9ACTN|nr:XRE family transcriptional regulator [Streptomyces diacarni]